MTDRVSRLEAAERRLDDALARFETALARAGGQDALAEASDASTLEGECGRLTATLADVRRHNDELRQLSRDAAARLDTAIAQIDLLLED